MKKLFLFSFFFICHFISALPSIQVTSDPVCFGQVSILKASSTLGDTAIVNWYWDLNNDGVFGDDSGKVVSYVFTGHPDTNLVGVKVFYKTNRWDSALGQKIIVNPVPVVNFITKNLCATQTAQFTGIVQLSKTGTISQYQWDFDNNGVIDDIGQQVSYNCGAPQSYTTRLICITNLGCSNSALKTTTVFPKPTAGFAVKGTCVNTPTFFANATTLIGDSIAYSLWLFGDKTQAVFSGSPQHTFSIPGSYSTQLIVVSTNNCRDTAFEKFIINPVPTCTIQPAADSVVRPGKPVTLLAHSSETNLHYLWSNAQQTNSILVTDSGRFNVTITDNNGCEGSASIHIGIIIPDDSVLGTGITIHSHVMTPNGDGINDYFEVEHIEQYYACQLVVYNRWNELVFQDDHYSNRWNGMSNGSPLDPGAYFYKLTVNGSNKVTGIINILH